MVDTPLDPQWFESVGPGTWPEWIAAIGTTAAFLVAAVAFAADVRRRKAAQARLVSAQTAAGNTAAVAAAISDFLDVWRPGNLKSEEFTESIGDLGFARLTAEGDSLHFLARVTVHNMSDELIGPVLYQCLPWGGETEWLYDLVAEVIEPNGAASNEVMRPWTTAPRYPQWDLSIAFRDSSGRWWTRAGSRPIKPVSRRRAREYEKLAVFAVGPC